MNREDVAIDVTIQDKHPEQAGGDERVIGWRERILAAHPNSDPGFWTDALLVEHMAAEIEDLRAALAQPSPALPPFAEKVLSKLRRFEECAKDFESGGVDIGRHWLDLLTQLGLLNRVQRSPALWEISQQGEDLLGLDVSEIEVPDSMIEKAWQRFERALQQLETPEQAEQAEQAEAERPEVVAYFDRNYPSTGDAFIWSNYEGSPYEPVMTVSQHERIVEARWNRAMDLMGEHVARISEKFKAERDAALARVEQQERTIAGMNEAHATLAGLYEAAQAQHSVPEGWKLVPVEPTEDVLEAIHNGGYVGDDQELRWFYQSILAAASA
ncbi:TPA: hypothetical protein ACKQDU_004519 [Pseudomonas aeruginosa]